MPLSSLQWLSHITPQESNTSIFLYKILRFQDQFVLPLKLPKEICRFVRSAATPKLLWSDTRKQAHPRMRQLPFLSYRHKVFLGKVELMCCRRALMVFCPQPIFLSSLILLPIRIFWPYLHLWIYIVVSGRCWLETWLQGGSIFQKLTEISRLLH